MFILVEEQLINWRLSKWNPTKARRVEQISKSMGYLTQIEEWSTDILGLAKNVELVDWQLDDTRGEIICNSCGLVVEENVIDPGAEWTNRDKTEDRSRVGQPLTYTLADKGSEHVDRRKGLEHRLSEKTRNKLTSQKRLEKKESY